MRPAKLQAPFVIAHVAVAAQDPGEDRAEEVAEHDGAARRGEPVDDKQRRDQDPEVAFGTVGAKASFIPVEDWLVRQRVCQRLARGGDRVAGFFPGRVRAAQTDRNVQRPFQ